MSKTICFFVLASLLLAANVSHAQLPEMMPFPAPINQGTADTGAVGHLPDQAEPGPPPPPHLPPVPDDYILNRKSINCCGPLGGDGPIRAELYVQSGLSLPVGGGILNDTLGPGWAIQGGARTMLFDPDRTAAWLVDLSASNVWNQGKNPNFQIPLSILAPNAALGGTVSRFDFGSFGVPGVTIRDLNRTFVNLGVGRDWFLGGAASGCDSNCAGEGGFNWQNCRWRVGADIGGRYGTGSIEFHEIRQRSHVFEGAFVGAHADVELPCGCCVYFAGIRAEWSYSWSTILQTQSNFDEFLVMFTAGVRY